MLQLLTGHSRVICDVVKEAMENGAEMGGGSKKMSDQPKYQENEGGGLRKSSEETQPRYLALRCPEQKICVCQSRNNGKFVK